VPTLSFRVPLLVGALAALSVGVWGIANVSGPLRTASSPSSSGRLALPAHVASGTAVEDDTREAPYQQPPETKPLARAAVSERTYLSYSLPDERSVQRLLSDFPDLSGTVDFRLANVRLATVPDEVLEKIALHGQNLTGFSILRPPLDDARSPGRPPVISDRGMEHISRMRNLRRLALRCEFSPEGFGHVARMENLELLSLSFSRLSAKECFRTVAKLPKIEIFGVHYGDFSEPIDDATHQAIASLNGRLVELNFGEWEAETKIHASLIPAIAEIDSLWRLRLGPVVGSLDDGTDYRDHLQKLTYLEWIDPSGTAPTLSRFRTRERFPVQYRTVESPGEMIVLLGYLIGESEARKLPREIIRRRLGLSPAEDFTKSRLPISQILKVSFDLNPLPGSFDRLRRLSLGYPEIDRQIRHYLSGLDIPVADEKADEKGVRNLFIDNRVQVWLESR
jgi:hypothetical protein